MLGIASELQGQAAQRGLRSAVRSKVQAIERLGTGKRLNRAADDVARSATATKLEAKIRSQGQAHRNINDAISLIQTAEGGCGQIQDILSRCRELAVQAGNGTLGSADLGYVQQEIDLLVAEIDRIANCTEYNGQTVLKGANSDDIEDIIECLKTNWLVNAETRITNQFGITADNVNLEIEVHTLDGAGGVAAYVSYYVDGSTGQGFNQELHIDIDDHIPAVAGTDGGTAPMYADRIIAHEMAHAVMGRAMNYASLPTWFKEGTAEFIHGADERVAGDIAASSFTGVRDQIGDGSDNAWGGNSSDYSAGYIATRYMHKELKASGAAPNGIKDLMQWMAADKTRTFDAAINNFLNGSMGVSNNAGFVSAFKTNVTSLGDADINTGNADTGAIGGADADGGAALTATSVIGNGGTLTDDPLTNFVEVWPDSTTDSFKFQVGIDGSSDSIFDASNYMPDVRATSLGLTSLDVTTNAGDVLDKFDTAISALGLKRSNLGAAQNRLAVSLSVSHSDELGMAEAKMKINDADIAEESAQLARSSILEQAGTAMVSQMKQNYSMLLELIGA